MKILFIGSRLFDDVDFYLKEKGIETVLTESNENALNLDLPDKVFIVPRGMDGPEQIAILEKVDAIIPLIGLDKPLIDVAILKEKIEKEYNIPVISSNVEAATITSNKIKTKKFFTDIGINTPKYQIIDKNTVNLSFPCVLKQGEGQGGKDIIVAKSIDDVAEYFETFNQALCEEFIDGSEISIEVLGYKGDFVALTPVYKGETTLEGVHPLFKVKRGPFNHDVEYIKETALKIAKNLDSDGIFEMDFMYSKEGELYAIEVNARPNGTRYLTSATCNIYSLIELINMAIGTFSSEDVNKRIKKYYSAEIPIGNYEGEEPNKPLKTFDNKNFIVHAPKDYQRITIRANSEEEILKEIDKWTN